MKRNDVKVNQRDSIPVVVEKQMSESRKQKEARDQKAELLALCAALVGFGVLCGCGRQTVEAPSKSAPPVAVQTVKPRRGEITRSVTLPSFRILAYQQATLYAKVSGYLEDSDGR